MFNNLCCFDILKHTISKIKLLFVFKLTCIFVGRTQVQAVNVVHTCFIGEGCLLGGENSTGY
jgi:hypothetical protein